MKRKVLTLLMAFSLVAGVAVCTVTPIQVAANGTSRIVGDANGDNAFDVKDLIRMKRWQKGQSVSVQNRLADLDWNGAIESNDITKCVNNLLNNTVLMELPEDDTLNVKMEQVDGQVQLTVKNTSKVWQVEGNAEVKLTQDSSTNSSTSINKNQTELAAEQTCSITVASDATKVVADIVAEYWSVPVNVE